MDKLQFVFGVHNHQPVGNFDFVIEDAYQTAYRPFLELAAGHPWFRFTLHNSGCLWEWLEEHHPEYFDLVRQLAGRGQLELMGGGFYEPILPAIPEADRRGQIDMMSGYLEKWFGARPAGAWVAERVWEPSLASTYAGAGIRYVALDDAHFKSAGKFVRDLDGYYLTEDQGRSIAAFPISQKLRYLVPFRQVDEVVAFLREASGRGPGALAILADDGEKFGVWPGTHQHVYTNGWLKTFLGQLEKNLDWLEMSTFRQALESTAAKGRIYLPTGSYTEMGEWVLEPEAEKVYSDLVGRLKREGSYDHYGPFIRGGIWRNFLTKYPEANAIYRKMLHLSARAGAAGEEVRRELYRGQCNCSYWHGIFGGLYLPHLRAALYRHLIRAENLLDRKTLPNWPLAEAADFDGDGRDELRLSNQHYNLYLKPDWGQAIFEWDIKQKETNLLDNLSRRPESYHRKIREHQLGQQAEGKSIHEITALKEEGLEKLLSYDRYPRLALVDHLLDPTASLDQVHSGTTEQGQGVLAIRWETAHKREGRRYLMTASGSLGDFDIDKRIAFDQGQSITVDYEWHNRSVNERTLRPGIEFNFGLLSPGEGRFCSAGNQKLSTPRLDTKAEDLELTRLTVHDQFRGLRVEFGLDQAMDLWRYPVETVSQSESGLERNYQCSCFLWHRTINMAAGERFRLRLTLNIEAEP